MKKILQNIKSWVGRFAGFLSTDIGIDLGTSNTLVYVKGRGILVAEPSVIALDKETNTVLAVGEEAKRMLGKTPGNIIATRPMKDGVIADFQVSEAMLRYFIKKVHKSGIFVHPRIVIAVPSCITEVERRAVTDSTLHAGARAVYLVEEPMAAAIGAGLPVQEPAGNMIVDIGGGTTEIAVISLAGIVFTKSLRIGGDEMDDAIIQHLKKTYNLLIGERTAERIKIEIGSAFPIENEMTMEVKGRDLAVGLPKAITISSKEVRQALSEPISSIIEIIRIALERTPPELSSDLVERGIVMAGGGALLRGIDKLISEETGLPVHIAEDPLSVVALGTGKILESPYLKKVTVSARLES